MFQPHSDTSKDAYLKLTSEIRQLDEVYKHIKESGNNGLTDSEVADLMKIPSSRVAARVATLRRQGLVKRSNNTRKINGRLSTINYATDSEAGKVAQEAQQRRDVLNAAIKELLKHTNSDGYLIIPPLDVKRLERMVK